MAGLNTTTASSSSTTQMTSRLCAFAPCSLECGNADINNNTCSNLLESSNTVSAAIAPLVAHANSLLVDQSQYQAALEIYNSILLTLHQSMNSHVSSPLSDLLRQHLPSTFNTSTTTTTTTNNSYDCTGSTCDVFQEDACDDGPRMLTLPVAVTNNNNNDTTLPLSFIVAIVEYNKGLLYHLHYDQSDSNNNNKSEHLLSLIREQYQRVIVCLQGLLRNENNRVYQLVGNTSSHNNINNNNNVTFASSLLELGMRVHNNMGQLCYNTASSTLEYSSCSNEGVAARSHFEASLVFADHLVKQHSTSTLYLVEYANVLSNRCRVDWMMSGYNSSSSIGSISDRLYADLRKVLKIRTAVLPWDHPDVAASHFNVATTEYARQSNSQATLHFLQYINIAKTISQELEMDDDDDDEEDSVIDHQYDINGKNKLDLVPALIYILLIKHEDCDDSMSLELTRGLRTLQDKRHDQGVQSSEVASVLNFVGTLLFHSRDFESALVFFREELCIEEGISRNNNDNGSSSTYAVSSNDLSVSVTCNNIGRILQELGNYNDAIWYYKRALEKAGENIQGDHYHYSHPSCDPFYNNNNHHHDNASNKNQKMLFTDTLEQRTKLLAPSTTNLYSTAWYNLGLINDKLGYYDDAIHAFKMSLNLRITMLGDNHPDVACLHYNIGVLQMEQHHLDDAAASFRATLRIRRTKVTGHLNDCHIIRSLEKLASLNKTKGNIRGALECFEQILLIQGISTEYDDYTRTKNMGITTRSVAELHHATGELMLALKYAMDSTMYLEHVILLNQIEVHKRNKIINNSNGDNGIRVADVEQLASTLLMVGSLFHEMSEPLQARHVFEQAYILINNTLCCSSSNNTMSSLLVTLCEVTMMLSQAPCAPQA